MDLDKLSPSDANQPLFAEVLSVEINLFSSSAEVCQLKFSLSEALVVSGKFHPPEARGVNIWRVEIILSGNYSQWKFAVS